MYAKNIWLDADENKKKDIFAFAKDYIHFLNYGKTERMAVKETKEIALKAGFKPLESYSTLKAGDKVFAINRNKNILLAVIGKKSIEDGCRILGAHIDSPRLDIKQNPLFEKEGFAMMETHYYGGIKKYQYTTIPLSLHGVVYKKDGTCIDIDIGDEDDDPVIGIPDLLIHLSAEQMTKPAAKVVEGENLDIIVGNIPDKEAKSHTFKQNILNLLKEKYGFEEEDFLSAELVALPAFKAKDFGLDRSMISGYGHDDKVCAYTSLRAVLEAKNPEFTSVCVLVDKEEVGSIGATGAQSDWFENTIAEMLYLETGKDSHLAIKHAMSNSMMLSSDVSCGVDPIYSSATENKNACYLGKGIVFNKYTGARGKSGCNDAMPEFVAFVRNAMDKNNLHYQTSEIGKVDQGGGGTIAYILGNYNMYVLDAGVPVLSMHSPMEIVSKADVYEAYLAYVAFLNA
jgi:aspartyl aminopeptidase